MLFLAAPALYVNSPEGEGRFSIMQMFIIGWQRIYIYTYYIHMNRTCIHIYIYIYKLCAKNIMYIYIYGLRLDFMILYSESKGWLFASTTRHSPGPARGTPVAQTGDTFLGLVALRLFRLYTRWAPISWNVQVGWNRAPIFFDWPKINTWVFLGFCSYL